jgi:hypothetical protein
MTERMIRVIDEFDAACKEEERTDGVDAWDVFNTIRWMAVQALLRERLMATAIERLQEWVRPPEDENRDPAYTADVELAARLVSQVPAYGLAPGGTTDEVDFRLTAGDLLLARIRVQPVREDLPACPRQAEMVAALGYGHTDESEAVVFDTACPSDSGHEVFLSVPQAGEMLADFGLDPAPLYERARSLGWEVER